MKLTFGKFEDTDVEALPRDYLLWLLSRPLSDQVLYAAIRCRAIEVLTKEVDDEKELT